MVKMVVRERIYASFAQLYGLLVGTAGGVCMFNVLPLFLFHYKVSVLELQKCVAILQMPWASQALVGALSDSFPIHSWHKRYYIMAAICFFSLMLVVTGVVDTVDASTVSLFFCSLCIVVIITLCEGHSANLQVYFNFSANIVPFMVGVEMVGSVIAAIIVGLLARSNDAKYSNYAFFIAIPFALQALYPLVAYPHDSMPGDHMTKDQDEGLLNPPDKPMYWLSSSMRMRITSNEWKLVIGMSLFGLVMMLPLLFTSSRLLYLVVATFVGGLSVASVVHVYPNEVEFCSLCTFVMLCNIFNTDIRASKDAFYTMPDSPLCTTGGPQYPVLYYYTSISILTGVAGCITTVLFAKYALHVYTVRNIVQASVIVSIFANMCDLSIAMGWNRSVGVADWFVFMFGEGVVGPVARVVQEMATGVWAAKAIEDSVTTRYAIFSSFRNLGTLQSCILGLMLTEGMGVRADMDEGCDYRPFPRLLLVSGLCMPILAIAAAYTLLPNLVVPASK